MKFGNNPDRTVMSLFYVGSIIYIEDDLSQKKNPTTTKTCRQSVWLLELHCSRYFSIKKYWRHVSLHDHDMSSEFDQNACQRSNSSIKGICTPISGFIESGYSRWILENASIILFFFLEIRKHAPWRQYLYILKIIFIGKAFLGLYISHIEVNGQSVMTEFFVYSHV